MTVFLKMKLELSEMNLLLQSKVKQNPVAEQRTASVNNVNAGVPDDDFVVRFFESEDGHLDELMKTITSMPKDAVQSILSSIVQKAREQSGLLNACQYKAIWQLEELLI